MNNNVKILKDELGISTLRIDEDAIVGFDVERFFNCGIPFASFVKAAEISSTSDILQSYRGKTSYIAERGIVCFERTGSSFGVCYRDLASNTVFDLIIGSSLASGILSGKVGDIENFSNVTLDGSAAGAVNNFETAKIVTSGTALWSDMYDYGRPEDYDLNLDAMDLKVTETKSLNGSVTLKNNAYAESIDSFQSVTMTGSDVGTISKVTKVTINKGDNSIGSYVGTDGNNTLNIAKGAVLTANQIDLGLGAKDTLAINGTLILTGTEVNAFKITGKGEIAAVSEVFADLDVAFANTLDVGETSENFRGTAYENADDSFKKAVKWDGKEEYNGWLGDWSGYTSGSDDVDYIKFKAVAGDELIVSGIDEENWTLFDGKGNLVKSKYIFADNEFKIAGEYIIKLENDADESIAYSIALA